MSAKVQGLIWDYYEPDRGGAPIILALALGDEADDHGGGIFQSNEALARKTRQTERAVVRQLRRMEEAGVLTCVQKSTGGAGKFSQYRLNIAALIVLKIPDSGSGITPTEGQGSDAITPTLGQGFFAPLYKGSKEELPDDGSKVRVEAEDERLAKWMLEQIRKLNPKHREPSWRSWLTDIRLMRERDKRTHREIAELFAWANADPFWRVNILSPGKLREQWDKLELKRLATVGVQTPGQTEDRRCVGERDGARCGLMGAFRGGDARWRCRDCRDQQQVAA